MDDVFQIIRVGLSDGLVWFPFVLGVGLLYKHFKVIDVSIDGTAVIAGIASAWAWTRFESYTISLAGAVLAGLLGYSVMWGLVSKLHVNPILAGVLYTLVVHSLSVLLVGESLVLNSTKLFSSFAVFSLVPLVTCSAAIALSEFFYRTNVGVAIRMVGSTPSANVRRNPQMLILLGFLLTGLIVGLGTGIYTHQQGVARSGGGFEFLVTGLSSFLVIDRLIEFLSRKVRAAGASAGNFGGSSSWTSYCVYSLIHSVSFKALLGSVLFQIIVLFVISHTPNPSYWKLLLGLALILSVAKPALSVRRGVTSAPDRRPCGNGVELQNVSASYREGHEEKRVFDKVSAHFPPGVNYIWGPNGSGKSTLLGCIKGTIPLDGGQIFLSGAEVTDKPAHRRPIYLLTQNPYHSVTPEMAVYENIIAASQHLRPALRITAPAVASDELYLALGNLEPVELAGTNDSIWLQDAGRLSGGQLQRVALYMAFSSEADIILADEPTSGFDHHNLAQLLAIFKSLATAGKTLIIVTHDERLARAEGQHFRIHEGKLHHVSAHPLNPTRRVDYENEEARGLV